MKLLISSIEDVSPRKANKCDGSSESVDQEQIETESETPLNCLKAAIRTTLDDIVNEATIKFSEGKGVDKNEWDHIKRATTCEKVKINQTFGNSLWLESLSSLTLNDEFQDLSIDTSESLIKEKEIIKSENVQEEWQAVFPYAIEIFTDAILPRVKPSVLEPLVNNQKAWRVSATQILFILYQFQKLLRFLLTPKVMISTEKTLSCHKNQSIPISDLLSLTRLILDWMDEDVITRCEQTSCTVTQLDATTHCDCVLSQLLSCYELCVEYEQTISKQKEGISTLFDEAIAADSSYNAAIALGVILCTTFHCSLNCSKQVSSGEKTIHTESFGATNLASGVAENCTLRSVLDTGLCETLFTQLTMSQQGTVNKALDLCVINMRPEYNIATPWTKGCVVRQAIQLKNSILNQIRQKKSKFLVEDISTKVDNASETASLILCLHTEREDLLKLVLHYSRALFFGRPIMTHSEARKNDNTIHLNKTVVTTQQSLKSIQNDDGLNETHSNLLTPVSTTSKIARHPDGRPRKRYPSGIYEPIQNNADGSTDYTLEKKPDARTPFWHTHPSRAVSTLFILAQINLSLLRESKDTARQVLDEILPVIYSLLDDYKSKHQIIGGCLLLHILSSSTNMNPSHILYHAPMIQQVLSVSIKVCRVPDALGVLSMCQSFLLTSALLPDEQSSIPDPEWCAKASVACHQLIHKAITTYTGLDVMDETADEKKQREHLTSTYNEGRCVTPAILVGGVIPLMVVLAKTIQKIGEWKQISNPGDVKVLASGVEINRTALTLFLPILKDYTPNCLFADSRGIEFLRILTNLTGLRLLLQCARPVIPHHGGKVMTAVLTVIGRIVTNRNLHTSDKRSRKTHVNSEDALDQFVLLYATSTAELVLNICHDRAEEVLMIGKEKCTKPVADVCLQLLQNKAGSAEILSS